MKVSKAVGTNGSQVLSNWPVHRYDSPPHHARSVQTKRRLDLVGFTLFVFSNFFDVRARKSTQNVESNRICPRCWIQASLLMCVILMVLQLFQQCYQKYVFEHSNPRSFQDQQDNFLFLSSYLISLFWYASFKGVSRGVVNSQTFTNIFCILLDTRKHFNTILATSTITYT